MPRRKVPLVKDELYHIYNTSIAKFKIFNSDRDYKRMIDEMIFYSIEKPPCKFSLYEKFGEKSTLSFKNPKFELSKKIVDIIAYCIMPTHIHLILKGLKEDGISNFLNLILKSYSQYFNLKHGRKGPLWEARFKNVLIESDEQFLHVTRYIHLNPVTAYLVKKPADWQYSSYREYISCVKNDEKLCNFSPYLKLDTQAYVNFVEDQIGYQRELAFIKNLRLE